MRKEITWSFIFNQRSHVYDKITFPKWLLIDFIGLFWYELFFDENDKLRHNLDYIIATAREFGKTYVVVAIIIYIMINNNKANFILTRKYGSAAGAFYEMFNQVLGDFEDKYQIKMDYKYYDVTKSKKTGKEKLKLSREIKVLKGKGLTALFSYGKTGDDKNAIFYNNNFDVNKNQIIFLRGADDADGSRGLSVNVGYIVANILEEYSQEVDKGKLEPEEQILRYKSLWKSANRYAKKLSHLEDYPSDLRTSQWALANIWDPKHEYNVNLLRVIPEDEWREFVSKDIENNNYIIREHDGIVYVRATSIANKFLYPKNSKQRQEMVQNLHNILNSQDDYAKAELLGFTFPGFLKNDSPVASLIIAIQNAPEMTYEELIEYGFEPEQLEFGTDPGLRDDTVSIPACFIKNYTTKEDGIYFDRLFEIENRERIKNKLPRIPNPEMKKQLLEFWNETITKYPEYVNDYIFVNMDMKALSIRDDFNYELFPKNKIKGKCSVIPTSEKKGYGLEQRINILEEVLRDCIFHPYTKSKLILTLKTLEKYADDKTQPHPRKGKMDYYDALAYAVVKLRHNITRGEEWH